MTLLLLLTACSGETPSAEKPPADKPAADKPVGAAVEAPVAVPAPADPCALPTTPAPSLEETAWRLFVASTCPTGDTTHPLAFQKWTEQSCLSNPAAAGCGGDGAPRKRQLHGSALRHALVATKSKETTPGPCSPMLTTANAPAALKPFVPQNLGSNPQFCEEVFANDAEIAYIRQPAEGQTLLTLAGQAAFVATGQKIQFPTDAVEVKADWIPATALATPFDCAGTTDGLYTEQIDGVCYALVGMHISSKLYPNWLWATFEPQNTATNPNRCNPALYNDCDDPWGSTPATSTGDATQQTPALAALMTAAKLPSELNNYRLVGVQTDYVDSKTTPLGNSFVELNAQVLPGQASCITCHSYAQFDSSQGPPAENPNFGAFPGTPPIGTPVTTQPPVPAGTWQAQDFSWMLGILPPA